MKRSLFFQIILSALVISASLYVKYAESISVTAMSSFSKRATSSPYGFSGNLTFSDLAESIASETDAEDAGKETP